MSSQVEELCCNLNELLNDICAFLSDELKLTKLSPQSRKTVDQLINRSKIQLQEIMKITKIETDGTYVDMQQNIVTENEDDKLTYSSIDGPVDVNNTIEIKITCPYKDIPVKDLNFIKFGHLSWKTKFLVKFEKFKRIYCGIYNNWLMIYSCEKDLKSTLTLNLRNYEAKCITGKSKKGSLSQDFQLVGESKSYYFIALTHKDMLQWVVNINKYCKRRAPSPLMECDSTMEYDDIIHEENDKNIDDQVDDTECIYQDIETLSPKEIKLIQVPPPVVPVLRKIDEPLPPIPDRTSQESLVFYDEAISDIPSDNSSFSHDDEDEDIYDIVVKGPTNVINDKGNRPAIPMKPNKAQEKPKNFVRERKKNLKAR